MTFGLGRRNGVVFEDGVRLLSGVFKVGHGYIKATKQQRLSLVRVVHLTALVLGSLLLVALLPSSSFAYAAPD